MRRTLLACALFALYASLFCAPSQRLLCSVTPGRTPSAAATWTPWYALRTCALAAPELGTLRCTLFPLFPPLTWRRFFTQVSLYDARHAQLLGTLDERRIDVRSSSDAIRDYFIAFLGGDSLSLTGSPT